MNEPMSEERLDRIRTMLPMLWDPCEYGDQGRDHAVLAGYADELLAEVKYQRDHQRFLAQLLKGYSDAVSRLVVENMEMEARLAKLERIEAVATRLPDCLLRDIGAELEVLKAALDATP